MDETIARAGWFRGRVYNHTELEQRFQDYPLLAFVTYPVYTRQQDALRGLLKRWREPPFKQHYLLVVHHPDWLLKTYFARELLVARHRVHLATLAPNTAAYMVADVLRRPPFRGAGLDGGGGRWLSPLFPLNLSTPAGALDAPTQAAELLASDMSRTVCIQASARTGGGARVCVWQAVCWGRGGWGQSRAWHCSSGMERARTRVHIRDTTPPAPPRCAWCVQGSVDVLKRDYSAVFRAVLARLEQMTAHNITVLLLGSPTVGERALIPSKHIPKAVRPHVRIVSPKASTPFQVGACVCGGGGAELV